MVSLYQFPMEYSSALSLAGKQEAIPHRTTIIRYNDIVRNLFGERLQSHQQKKMANASSGSILVLLFKNLLQLALTLLFLLSLAKFVKQLNFFI